MLDSKYRPTIAVRWLGERDADTVDWAYHVEVDHERELTDQTQAEVIADHVEMHRLGRYWGHVHPEGL